MPVVRGIVRKASQNDYKFASIITGIVESPMFQMRTKLEPSSELTSSQPARGLASLTEPLAGRQYLLARCARPGPPCGAQSPRNARTGPPGGPGKTIAEARQP
jgi:hypothetical protein